LVELFCEAFSDDPLLTWIAGRRDRQRALQLFFEGVLSTECLPAGDILVERNMEACSIWLPAGSPAGCDGLTHFLWMVRVAGLWRVSRLYRLLTTLARCHPAGGQHSSLAFMAVRPDIRDRGLGSRMMRCSLERLDRLGRPAYAESHDPRNHRFYRRLGFAVAGQIDLGAGAPTIHQMWRAPKSSAGAT
jgi:GNAT superfamily N-acetyltransferase